MPIDVSGSNGQTTISGSNTTISGSDGTTIISGSVLSGSQGIPALSLPVGDETITGSLPYLTTTGSIVIAQDNTDNCFNVYINVPTGSSPNTNLKWVLLTSSCPQCFNPLLTTYYTHVSDMIINGRAKGGF